MATGVLAFWICLKDVSWTEVGNSLQNVSVLPLFGVIACMFSAYVFRARRWSLLLKPLRTISWRESFAINAVGFLSINVLPLRLGEFTRPYLMKKRHKITMTTGMALVIIERVFDGLACTLALFIGLISISDATVDMSGWTFGLQSLAWGAFFLFFPVLVVFVLLVVKKELALKVVAWLTKMLPASIQTKITQLTNNFVIGLSALPNMKTFLLVSLETIGVWGGIPLAYLFLMSAFSLDLPWTACFTVTGIAALGVMIPGPPGFVGTFQLFVQAALAVYGVSKSVGFALSMVFFTLNLLFVLVIGLIFLKRMATPLATISEEILREP